MGSGKKEATPEMFCYPGIVHGLKVMTYFFKKRHYPHIWQFNVLDVAELLDVGLGLRHAEELVHDETGICPFLGKAPGVGCRHIDIFEDTLFISYAGGCLKSSFLKWVK
jgi:hypothetical protein